MSPRSNPRYLNLRPTPRRIEAANRLASGHRPDSWRPPGTALPPRLPKFRSVRSGHREPDAPRRHCRKSHAVQPFGSLFRYPRQSHSAYQTPFVSLWMWIEALGGEWGGNGRQIAPCRDISVPTLTCTGGGKPLLNGSGSYLAQNWGSGFALGVGGYPLRPRQLRHSCNTRRGPCRQWPLTTGTAAAVWVLGSWAWIDRLHGRAVGESTRYESTWHRFHHHRACAGRLHARDAGAGDAGGLECAR